MARIGKRLNSSHYAATNAYNSPFGIGHHYGSLGGLGGQSNTMLHYTLIGAAAGAAYSVATKQKEMKESALYGAAIGAILALLMGNKNGSAVIAEEVVVASNGGGGNGGLSPSKADLEAAAQLTSESPGSCPDGMILIPANDGTGELVCAPIDTGLPEITWQEQQPFAEKIAIGPVTSMTDLARADLGPVHRKTNGYDSGAKYMPISY